MTGSYNILFCHALGASRNLKNYLSSQQSEICSLTSFVLFILHEALWTSTQVVKSKEKKICSVLCAKNGLFSEVGNFDFNIIVIITKRSRLGFCLNAGGIDAC